MNSQQSKAYNADESQRDARVNAEGWRLVCEAYQVLLTTPTTIAATNKAEELLRLAIVAAPSPQQQQADHIPDTTKMVQGDDELVKALEYIADYWNRDRNDKAMHDACWHASNTAEEALANYRARKGEQ